MNLQSKSRPAGGLVWGTRAEAARIAAVDAHSIERVIAAAGVRTRHLPGMARPQVCLSDLRAVLDTAVAARAATA